MIKIISKQGEEVSSYVNMDLVLTLLKAHKEEECLLESIDLNGYVITDIDGLVNSLIFV